MNDPQSALHNDFTPLPGFASSTGAGTLEHSAGAEKSGGMMTYKQKVLMR